MGGVGAHRTTGGGMGGCAGLLGAGKTAPRAPPSAIVAALIGG